MPLGPNIAWPLRSSADQEDIAAAEPVRPQRDFRASATGFGKADQTPAGPAWFAEPHGWRSATIYWRRASARTRRQVHKSGVRPEDIGAM